MKRTIIVFGAVVLIQSAAISQANAAERQPAQVYQQVCAYCHGANVGPVIRGRALPPVLIKTLVRSGLNAMPAFRPTEISERELDALALWIEKSAADPAEHGR